MIEPCQALILLTTWGQSIRNNKNLKRDFPGAGHYPTNTSDA